MNFLFLSLLAAFIVLCILFFLNLLLIENGLNYFSREENSSYECGFEHNSLSRVPFSLRYFLLTVIFLVFDMEIVLITFLPNSLHFSLFNESFYLSLLFFILVLLLGLFYEWYDGSLDWVL